MAGPRSRPCDAASGRGPCRIRTFALRRAEGRGARPFAPRSEHSYTPGRSRAGDPKITASTRDRDRMSRPEPTRPFPRGRDGQTGLEAPGAEPEIRLAWWARGDGSSDTLEAASKRLPIRAAVAADRETNRFPAGPPRCEADLRSAGPSDASRETGAVSADLGNLGTTRTCDGDAEGRAPDDPRHSRHPAKRPRLRGVASACRGLRLRVRRHAPTDAGAKPS